MTTDIKAGTLKGLLRVVPRTLDAAQYRPSIFGVTFEPDGLVMATDGCMLIAMHNRVLFDGPGFVMPADQLRALIKGKKPREYVEVVRPVEPIAPPAWRKTVPDTYSKDTEGNVVNPKLVLSLRDAINDVQEAEGLAHAARPLKVLTIVPNGCRAWLAYATGHVLATVMPMRRSQDVEERALTCAADFFKGCPDE